MSEEGGGMGGAGGSGGGCDGGGGSGTGRGVGEGGGGGSEGGGGEGGSEGGGDGGGGGGGGNSDASARLAPQSARIQHGRVPQRAVPMGLRSLRACTPRAAFDRKRSFTYIGWFCSSPPSYNISSGARGG